ncbi:MAG: SDR family oxidoreductase [Clostridia bacterium]|nr:SDR family oxidoreductase [Clostridia bacterium]
MKVALVTGGSRGIGAKTVTKFAENGFSVILNYNKSEAQAISLQQDLNKRGFDVHLYKADVSNEQEVKAMFDYVAKYFKHLDVLVNNAGLAQKSQLQDVTESYYNRIMDVNAKGTFFCCKYALDCLKKSATSSIVNVSSIWGLRGASCESVYCMSKHAVVGLTRSLSEELCGLNVNVNAICPPIVLTDMTAEYTQKDIENFCKDTATKAYDATEIAEQIYRLATSNTTGQIVEL